jgi:hypothetical protein
MRSPGFFVLLAKQTQARRNAFLPVYLDKSFHLGRNSSFSLAAPGLDESDDVDFSQEEQVSGDDLALANDPAVSARHLFVYSVLFEESKIQDIPPSVYALDVSRNGTFLARKGAINTVNSNSAKALKVSFKPSVTDSEQSMVPKRPVLLMHGDFLRISPHSALQFRYFPARTPSGSVQLEERQKLEARV